VPLVSKQALALSAGHHYEVSLQMKVVGSIFRNNSFKLNLTNLKNQAEHENAEAQSAVWQSRLFGKVQFTILRR
jgi:hypothetical protein